MNFFVRISFVVPKSSHLFFFIHCKIKVTNHNEIQCYRVNNIFKNTSIITIKKQSKLTTLIRMCHIYSFMFLNYQKHGKFFIIHCIKRDCFLCLGTSFFVLLKLEELDSIFFSLSFETTCIYCVPCI